MTIERELRTVFFGGLAAITLSAGCAREPAIFHEALPAAYRNVQFPIDGQSTGSKDAARNGLTAQDVINAKIAAYASHNASTAWFMQGHGTEARGIVEAYDFVNSRNGPELITIQCRVADDPIHKWTLVYEGRDPTLNKDFFNIMSGDTLILNDSGYVREVRPVPRAHTEVEVF
jgi:hypothetical protein